MRQFKISVDASQRLRRAVPFSVEREPGEQCKGQLDGEDSQETERARLTGLGRTLHHLG